jgi:UDP-glucose 4-epimerase
VFITGGAGFIGSHLVEALVERNRVTIYDVFHRDALRFTRLREHPHVRVVRGDVLDGDALRRAMEGADILVHAAAIAGIYSVGQSLTRTMGVNLLGTVAALDAALATGVRRVVEFSTSEVYGPFVFRGRETDRLSVGPAGERRWIYAVSKLAGEHFAAAYAADHGVDIVSIRPFNVYGPRQVGEGAIQQMAQRALSHQDITVYNDGTQIRSWCYIGDFVDGLCRVLASPEGGHRTFNLGNPQATTTVLGLAQSIIRLAGSRSQIVFRPHPGPEVEMRIPDITSAREVLGFNPEVGLDEGLRRSLAWYEAHPLH